MIKSDDPLARSSQTKEAVDVLRRDIILGKYKKNTRIIENKLAEQLGISRAPIRTAIQILAQEGLVVNLPNGGTLVVGLSLSDIKNMFDLRLQLEKMALQQAMKQDILQYRPLFEALEQFELIKSSFQLDEITSLETARLDVLFHRSIVAISNNLPLQVAWNTMSNTMQAILEITNMTSETFTGFYNDHKKLADLIIQKNELCYSELEHHVLNAKSIIVQRIEQSIDFEI